MLYFVILRIYLLKNKKTPFTVIFERRWKMRMNSSHHDLNRLGSACATMGMPKSYNIL